MKYRSFGSLGWKVSRLGFGTVSLGVPYGFRHSREAAIPERKESVGLLIRSFEAGVNLVDTAPSYGIGEQILGQALSEWQGNVLVATKTSLELGDSTRTLHNSLRALKRDSVDLLQVHNWGPGQRDAADKLAFLLRTKEQGKARAIGVSVYEAHEALAAIESAPLDAVQIPFHCLNAETMRPVIESAAARGVAVLGRSALLKGVLSERRTLLPPHLAQLRTLSDSFAFEAQSHGMTITQAALQFCFSEKSLTAVLLGIRNQSELLHALEEEVRPESPLSWIAAWDGRPPGIEPLLDPRNWRHE